MAIVPALQPMPDKLKVLTFDGSLRWLTTKEESDGEGANMLQATMRTVISEGETPDLERTEEAEENMPSSASKMA